MPGFGGVAAHPPIRGATFKDYKDSQRTASSGPSTDSGGADSGTSERVDSRIVTAAGNIVAWGTKTGNNHDVGSVERFLDGRQKSLSDPLQGDYGDSLVQFSRDVLASAGPQENVNQLIEWRLTRFTAAQAQAAEAEQAKAIKDATERQAALVLAGAAAAAFLAFLILLFVFVLVKIERNLRVVMVQNAAAPDGATRNLGA